MDGPPCAGTGLEREGMTLVRDVMQEHPATLDVGDTLDLADDVMRLGRVRHFPILDGGRLVGVLSHRDLLAAAASSLLQLEWGTARDWLAKIRIGAVMSTTLHTVAPSRDVRDAVDLMLRHKVGCLPVVEDDRLVGLVSETDCLRLLSHLLALEHGVAGGAPHAE